MAQHRNPRNQRAPRVRPPVTREEFSELQEAMGALVETVNTVLSSFESRLIIAEHVLADSIESIEFDDEDEDEIPGDGPGSAAARERHEQLDSAPGPGGLEDPEMDDDEWARQEAARLRAMAEAERQSAIAAAEEDFDPNE